MGYDDGTREVGDEYGLSSSGNKGSKIKIKIRDPQFMAIIVENILSWHIETMTTPRILRLSFGLAFEQMFIS